MFWPVDRTASLHQAASSILRPDLWNRVSSKSSGILPSAWKARTRRSASNLHSDSRTVGVRELKNRLSQYLNEAEEEGAVIVTHHGVPRAAIIPLSPDELEDFIIAHSPRIRKMVRRGLRK